jgi:hypothetical protein
MCESSELVKFNNSRADDQFEKATKVYIIKQPIYKAIRSTNVRDISGTKVYLLVGEHNDFRN